MIVGHKEALSKIPKALPPCVLITGPEGVGKSILANVLAYSTGVHPSDFTRHAGRFTMTASKEVKDKHSRFPLEGSVVVSVVNLTEAPPAVQNSLLSTIETPAPYSRFIFYSDAPPLLTLSSRCHEIRLGYLSEEEIFEILRRRHVPPSQAEEAAKFAEGRVSKALNYAYTEGSRKQAGAILRAVAERSSDKVQSALYDALPRGAKESVVEAERRRTQIGLLLRKSLHATFTTPDHPLNFVPEERRFAALSALESPARRSVAIPNAVWLMIEEP